MHMCIYMYVCVFGVCKKLFVSGFPVNIKKTLETINESDIHRDPGNLERIISLDVAEKTALLFQFPQVIPFWKALDENHVEETLTSKL